MRSGLRIAVTVAFLAWAYSLIAVLQLPNASSMDEDPYVGRAR